MPSIPQQRRMELSSIRRCFITYRECNANTNSPTLYSNLHFNQRTRMGCDISRTKEEAHRGVSIHAPTWGATFCSRIVRLLSPFQSTHPHGVRPAKAGELLPVYWFQSTHPHEVRQPSLSPSSGRETFQSTHPHGVRLQD